MPVLRSDVRAFARIVVKLLPGAELFPCGVVFRLYPRSAVMPNQMPLAGYHVRAPGVPTMLPAEDRPTPAQTPRPASCSRSREHGGLNVLHRWHRAFPGRIRGSFL